MIKFGFNLQENGIFDPLGSVVFQSFMQKFETPRPHPFKGIGNQQDFLPNNWYSLTLQPIRFFCDSLSFWFPDTVGGWASSVSSWKFSIFPNIICIPTL